MLSRHQLMHDSWRILAGYLITICVVVVFLSACDRDKNAQQAEKPHIVQEQVVPVPPAPPPTLWYEGKWHSTVAIDKQDSKLSLVVNKAGQASGELTTSSGR